MSNETQKSWVLKQLMSGKAVTPLDALQGCGCFRLASAIHRLRDELAPTAYTIRTLKHTTRNGAVIAKYKMFNRGKSL